MVWVVEKKVVRHILDMGFERVEIPVRIKFEFEVREGLVVPGTLSREMLYNQKVIVRRYPKVELGSLDRSIEKTVEREITKHLKRSRLLPDDSNGPS